MASWLQNLVVTVHAGDDLAETLKYAVFLADTYGAALDVMHVLHCPKTTAGCSEVVTSGAGATTCDVCRAQEPDLSLAQRRNQIEELLRGCPGDAARRAVVEIGEPLEIEAALKRKAYDLAVLDQHCGRRCAACKTCPVFSALSRYPACGITRVEGPVQIPSSEVCEAS